MKSVIGFYLISGTARAKGKILGRPKGHGKSRLDDLKPEIEALLKNGSSKTFIAKTRCSSFCPYLVNTGSKMKSFYKSVFVKRSQLPDITYGQHIVLSVTYKKLEHRVRDIKLCYLIFING